MTQVHRYGNAREFISQGLGVQAYPVQLQIISELFGDVCWFCTDEKYRDSFWTRHDVENNIMFMRHGVCPRCASLRKQLVEKRLDQFASKGMYMIGQRGGSTVMSCFASLYAEHCMLNEKLGSSTLHAGNNMTQLLISPTREEAQTVWETRERLRQASPWYAEHDARYPKSDIQCSDLGRDYTDLGVSVKAVTSQACQLPRGYRTYFSVVSNSAYMSNAAEIMKTLDDSTRSLHLLARDACLTSGTGFNPCVMHVSARHSSKDLVFEQWCKRKLNLPDYQDVIAKKVATWNINPSLNKAVLHRGMGTTNNVAQDFGCDCEGDTEQVFEIAKAVFCS